MKIKIDDAIPVLLSRCNMFGRQVTRAALAARGLSLGRNGFRRAVVAMRKLGLLNPDMPLVSMSTVAPARTFSSKAGGAKKAAVGSVRERTPFGREHRSHHCHGLH